MKAVLIVALLALIGLAAAQTKCETIMSVISSSNGAATDPIQNSTQFLQRVVGRTIERIVNDSNSANGVKTSLYRYFAGANGYPNILGDATRAGNLVNKLIGWFAGYLECTGTIPAPYTAAQLNLTDSHAYLKISKTDAELFNTRVMLAIVDILVSQNVDVSNAGVVTLATQVAGDLAALIPTYTVNPTNICDKYATRLTALGQITTFGTEGYGNVDFSFMGTDVLNNNLNVEFQTNLANRGPGYAFWFYFVKNAVVLGELVGNSTVNAQLGKYFNGSKGTPNYFTNTAALGTLINKLTAWFGQPTGCSDQEFISWAKTTGSVDTAGVRINLSASHQGLMISAADSTLFNTAITRQAVAALTPLNLSNEDATAVVGLLNSVSSQVVYQPPAPVAAPVAAGPAPTAPKAPSVATPKASGSAVVASFGLIVASLLALLF
eukprot:TRINITY_DN8787_c0_g1_i1.p2 TRINITY_DN8787_c0_g1~~TRINITY_DN8787_c0_g1_i1.p2  ORF type:complete len:437 (+),score=146.93 TRINITY_DN8787_c0_g1_i1:84-1394(+)